MLEINKKDRHEKGPDLLDTKCYMKLVDVAHSLLKMAPYDLECMRARGLQKYMKQLFPLTDWSLESMRPSLITIIRRVDKLFSKIHKNSKHHSVDWNSAAGLLKGIYDTVWRHPYIAGMPNLKSLIGTCQCMVIGEDSLTSLSDHHSSMSKRQELPPQTFCSVVFRLVALQVLVLGNTFTLEQRMQLSEPAGGGIGSANPSGGLSGSGGSSYAVHSLLTQDKGESLLLNLLLPLCLKVGSGRKDAPKMRQIDVKFALNLLVNLLNPSRSAKGSTNASSTQTTGHPTFGQGFRTASTYGGTSRSNVHYNPSGDSNRVKASSLEIGFLGEFYTWTSRPGAALCCCLLKALKGFTILPANVPPVNIPSAKLRFLHNNNFFFSACHPSQLTDSPQLIRKQLRRDHAA